MEFSHVSPETYLLTEDDRTIKFKKYRNIGEDKPHPDECKGKIKGVCLSYAFCGEQDFGIRPLADAFGVKGNNGIINKVPLEIVEADGVRAIRYGKYASLDDDMVQGAMEAGLIGYWDDANLIICAAPEYGFIIDSIKNMFKPKHVRFGFHTVALQIRNLLILAM